MYVATEWITTKVESSQSSDVMAAFSRLENYCQKQNEAGMSSSVTKCLSHTVVQFCDTGRLLEQDASNVLLLNK